MKKIALSFLLLMLSLSSAYALPFVKAGPKVGYGTVMPLDLPGAVKSSDETTFAVGAGAMFSLAVIQIEANLLYGSTGFSTSAVSASLTGAELEVKTKQSLNTINMPLIARFNFSPIPLLNLAIGAGYEKRVLISSEAGSKDISNKMNGSSDYLPFSLSMGGDIPMLFSASLELRYSHQLTSWYKDNGIFDKNTTYDDFMAFASIYF